MSQEAQELVKGFRGENRVLSDDELPDHVGVDGLNVDYSGGTLRKREGRRRLHSGAILEGGVHIANVSQARAVWIGNHAAYGFTGDFTVEFCFLINSSVASTARVLMTCRNTSTTKGWACLLNASNEVSFIYYDGIGTARTVAVAVTNGVVNEREYHFQARRSGNDVTVQVTDIQSGTTDTSSAATASGYSVPDRPIFIGGEDGTAPAVQTLDYVVDEFRLWNVYRSDGELEGARERELTEDEIEDPELVGYWPLNDGRWNAVRDRSLTQNHGTFDDAGPSFERSIVLTDSSDGFAVRFDGLDDYGVGAYHADYAPILDTGTQWTVEGWLRLDKDVDASAVMTILHLGGYGTGNGAVFTWEITNTTVRRFLLRFSTASSYSNQATNVASIILPVGVPVHLATVRDGSTTVIYVNGQAVETITNWGIDAEGGPTSDTSYGMMFGGRNTGGSYSNYAPVTLDDVRVWKSARSHNQIQGSFRRALPDVTDPNLVGYWRFDTSDVNKDETGRADITFKVDGVRPAWGRGIVYPVEPPRMLLCAPVTRTPAGNEALASDGAVGREFLVATGTGFHSLIGNKTRYLRDWYTPGEATLFDWCHFRDKVVCVNGVEANQKYDGLEVPRGLSIATPAAPCSAATGAAGNVTGAVQYRVAFRNSRDGTESLASAASASVTAASQKVNLSSLPVSSDPQVNQRRIYRLDPGSTVYRYLGDVGDNTTTTYEDNTAAGLASAPLSNARGHAGAARCCAVYANRLFLGNVEGDPSALVYSEAGEEWAFPATNLLYVDRGDGDEITGIVAAFSGLVIFKSRSIHFLLGEGPTTWQLRRVVEGNGCVSGHTIAKSAAGLYYLGHDGVYRLSAVGAAEAVAGGQSPLFETLDAERYRFAAGVYDIVRHVYLVTFDRARAEKARYYDVRPDLFANYWSLEADGDDLAGANDLTAQGTPAYVLDSALGLCARLDGSGDYFSGAYTTYPEDLSFGLWFNPTSMSTGTAKTIGRLRDKDSVAAFELEHYVYGAPRFQVRNSTSSMDLIGSYYTFEANTWYHLAVVRRAGVAKIYINGRLAAWTTTVSGAATLDGTGTFVVGDSDNDCKVKNAWFSAVALTDSQVRELYAYESPIGYTVRDRIAMAYDEETDSGAQWDVSPDAMVNGSAEGNRVELFSAEKGFVFRLFDGHQEGSDFVGGYAVTRTGSLTANGTNVISDAGYVFPSEFDGLAGTPVLVVAATTGERQWRIVVSNTATAMYLNKPLEPAVTGVWYLAPIDWFWESRWMDMGSAEWVKRIMWLLVWVIEDATSTVTVKTKTEYDETWKVQTFTTVDEFLKLSTPGRGRRVKVRFEAVHPGYEGVEVRGVQFVGVRKRGV